MYIFRIKQPPWTKELDKSIRDIFNHHSYLLGKLLIIIADFLKCIRVYNIYLL